MCNRKGCTRQDASPRTPRTPQGKHGDGRCKPRHWLYHPDRMDTRRTDWRPAFLTD